MSEREGVEPQDDQVRCPRCRTTRLKVLKKLDRIEKLYGNALMNLMRARRGDTIYHCVYCRLQFYDPRKPGTGRAVKGAAEKSSAPEKTEPEPGKKSARAAAAPASRRHSSGQAAAAPVARAATPIVSSRPLAPGGTNVPAGVTIRGSIQSAEDIYVDGRVEGTLASQNHSIIIGPNGTVKATVRACELEVLGTLHGNSHIASKVTLRKGSKVTGDIKTCDIVIEDGARFRGAVHRIPQQARLPLV